MTMERRTLGTRMRAVRQKGTCSADRLRLPDRMLESMRQSLSVEGYDVSMAEVRRVADETFKKEMQEPNL